MQVAEVSHEEPAPVIEELLPEPEKSNDDEDVESLKESVAGRFTISLLIRLTSHP